MVHMVEHFICSWYHGPTQLVLSLGADQGYLNVNLQKWLLSPPSGKKVEVLSSITGVSQQHGTGTRWDPWLGEKTEPWAYSEIYSACQCTDWQQNLSAVEQGFQLVLERRGYGSTEGLSEPWCSFNFCEKSRLDLNETSEILRHLPIRALPLYWLHIWYLSVACQIWFLLRVSIFFQAQRHINCIFSYIMT